MSDHELHRRHDHRTILVTGACGVTSRTVVRALRRSPWFGRIRLVGTDVCDNSYGLYEGLFERIVRVPPSRATADYHAAIGAICAAERVDAAIVIPEPEVLHWVEHPMPVPALLPPPGFARLAISKATLYDTLQGTAWAPRHAMRSPGQIVAGDLGGLDRDGGWPLWLREAGAGSTSGKGALCARDAAQAAAWMALNPDARQFMVSDFLPGRNLACLLLYHQGRLLKTGGYERLEYFMARTALSGITGNICKGRLLNDAAALRVSCQAIEHLCALTGEAMSGLVTVDLREDAHGQPRITEINLRPVAAASAFAEVPGANLIEAWLLATLGEPEAAGPLEVAYPPGNRILRDIDGRPIFVAEHHEPALGEAMEGQREQRQGATA